MKKIIFAIMLFSMCFSTFAAIHGQDDRLPIGKILNYIQERVGKSVLAMISKKSIKFLPKGLARITGKTLRESHNPPVCSSVRFANQISEASCTGFLVAPDLIVTAGHCIEAKKCDFNYRWVFGFRQDNKSPKGKEIIISRRDVYKCERVLEFSPNDIDKNGHDYALIQLNRVVRNRRPLRVRKIGVVARRTPVFALGHSLGLPLLVAGNGSVFKSLGSYSFQTNLDVYAGNSGGPIVNRRTNRVEGIVSKSGGDGLFGHLVYDIKRKCSKLLRKPLVPKLGTAGTRILSIPNIHKRIGESYLLNGLEQKR